jgi:hypothetical protein
VSPHRLTHHQKLSSEGLPGWRWWLIRHTPTILIDYLFEVLLTVIAFITSGAYFAGLTSETAVIRLLPEWLANLYGSVLLVGAVVITVGFATRRYGTLVAYGLRTLAIACAVYSASAIWRVGMGAFTPIVLSLGFGVLALWRGFILTSTYLYVKCELERKREPPGGAQ